MAKAAVILDYREAIDGGLIVAVKVWHVPNPVPGSTHSFKYPLFFGRPGERPIGYDNERGKGDHRQYGKDKSPYVFVSIERRMQDFVADVERARGQTT